MSNIKEVPVYVDIIEGKPDIFVEMLIQAIQDDRRIILRGLKIPSDIDSATFNNEQLQALTGDSTIETFRERQERRKCALKRWQNEVSQGKHTSNEGMGRE